VTIKKHNKSLRFPLSWISLFLIFANNISVTYAQIPNDVPVKVWINLDESCFNISDMTPIHLDEKALLRLQNKARNHYNPIDNLVPGAEIHRQIESRVQKILTYSRSLRAYSALVKPSQISEIEKLSCVKNIEPVGIFKRPTIPTKTTTPLRKALGNTGDYGNSFDQLEQLNIPAVHALGYTGSGVRIAIIDAGFYKNHNTFQHILNDSRLIAERDFIFKDYNVQDETSSDTTKKGAQQSHGTSVWSLIGGYEPDIYIGAAYNAEFLLAKSEYIGSETIVEENWYVEAVEWAEAKGADIISTSVSYRNFDNPEDDHSYEELDGKTTRAARAINWAFERGVLPVISAGNDAQIFPQDGGILTPSDAIGALAVGAVDINGQLAGFSSHGPTIDNRTKPDLCALGVNNYVASANSIDSYINGSGTSYSAPLIAGASALLMEKYPNLTPIYIIQLLKTHASLTNSPSYRYGWGIPDVYSAITAGDSIISHNIAIERNRLYSLPNPSKSAVSFLFQWSQISPSQNHTSLKVYNLLGELVWSFDLLPQIAGIKEAVPWNLKNYKGEIVPSGVYIVAITDGHTRISGKCLINK